jgi:hypothetical protein
VILFGSRDGQQIEEMAERGRIRTSGWLFTTAAGKPATALANGNLSTFVTLSKVPNQEQRSLSTKVISEPALSVPLFHHTHTHKRQQAAGMVQKLDHVLEQDVLSKQRENGEGQRVTGNCNE